MTQQEAKDAAWEYVVYGLNMARRHLDNVGFGKLSQTAYEMVSTAFEDHRDQMEQDQEARKRSNWY